MISRLRSIAMICKVLRSIDSRLNVELEMKDILRQMIDLNRIWIFSKVSISCFSPLDRHLYHAEFKLPMLSVCRFVMVTCIGVFDCCSKGVHTTRIATLWGSLQKLWRVDFHYHNHWLTCCQSFDKPYYPVPQKNFKRVDRSTASFLVLSAMNRTITGGGRRRIASLMLHARSRVESIVWSDIVSERVLSSELMMFKDESKISETVASQRSVCQGKPASERTMNSVIFVTIGSSGRRAFCRFSFSMEWDMDFDSRQEYRRMAHNIQSEQNHKSFSANVSRVYWYLPILSIANEVESSAARLMPMFVFKFWYAWPVIQLQPGHLTI